MVEETLLHDTKTTTSLDESVIIIIDPTADIKDEKKQYFFWHSVGSSQPYVGWVVHLFPHSPTSNQVSDPQKSLS